MNKKLNKPFVKNIRLDSPLGLLGVPPDAPFMGTSKNVLIIARLTDGQYNALIDSLCSTEKNILKQ